MSQFYDTVPVLCGNAPLVPILDSLRGQREQTCQVGAAADFPDDSSVQIVHACNVGGNMPPRQAEFRPARRGRQFPHDSDMSNKPRPEAYTEVAQAIGQRIRWARELVEPNRAEFARAMGVDRSTVRDIESGRRPPSIFAVIEISHRLRVTPNYILLGNMQGVDGELAGRLAVQHPELVQPWPSTDTPDTDSSGSTSRRPRRRARDGAPPI